VIASGTPHTQFLDDLDYPFRVNPHFKAWVPLTRVPLSWLVVTPGQRPKLVYYQPHDYWHVVPDAPAGYWTEHFDVQIVRIDNSLTRNARYRWPRFGLCRLEENSQNFPRSWPRFHT